MKTFDELIEAEARNYTEPLEQATKREWSSNAENIYTAFKAGAKFVAENLHTLVDENFFSEVIAKWKHRWMYDVTGTNEEDRKNYFNRAYGVDANMRYDLAKMLELAIKNLEKEIL